MARKPSNFKAQLITVDGNNQQVKRSFSKIRPDIADSDLYNLAAGIGKVLDHESPQTMNLTANSNLNLVG